MAELTSSPFFGIALSIIAFSIGVWIQKKTGLVVCNPLICAGYRGAAAVSYPL